MKMTIPILALLMLSCTNNTIEIKDFKCRNTTIKVQLPKIIKVNEQSFIEGKTTLLTTIDTVYIEFYCGGNYSPHINNKEGYKTLTKNKNSTKGIDLNTGKYWRKDGKLIYSNCKIKDTAFYNKVFNNKKIIK